MTVYQYRIKSSLDFNEVDIDGTVIYRNWTFVYSDLGDYSFLDKKTMEVGIYYNWNPVLMNYVVLNYPVGHGSGGAEVAVETEQDWLNEICYS